MRDWKITIRRYQTNARHVNLRLYFKVLVVCILNSD